MVDITKYILKNETNNLDHVINIKYIDNIDRITLTINSLDKTNNFNNINEYKRELCKNDMSLDIVYTLINKCVNLHCLSILTNMDASIDYTNLFIYPLLSYLQITDFWGICDLWNVSKLFLTFPDHAISCIEYIDDRNVFKVKTNNKVEMMHMKIFIFEYIDTLNEYYFEKFLNYFPKLTELKVDEKVSPEYHKITNRYNIILTEHNT